MDESLLFVLVCWTLLLLIDTAWLILAGVFYCIAYKIDFTWVLTAVMICGIIFHVISRLAKITIQEYSTNCMRRNPIYSAVESYLTASSSRAVSDYWVVGDLYDKFRGKEFVWSFTKEPRSYQLRFDRFQSQFVFNDYLPHILEEGTRQLKLYINNAHDSYPWRYAEFQHSATFNNLIIDPTTKQEIMTDLDSFLKGKDHFSGSLGQPRKRNYLLYGPPGTAKSSVIAALANYLHYDLYVFDITIVTTNFDLRKLLIQTTNRSIIVFEDIDYLLELTAKNTKDGEDDDRCKVTLSGLLNIIKGTWFACEEERLVVFTTHCVEKLDLGLLRGQMDKLIQILSVPKIHWCSGSKMS